MIVDNKKGNNNNEEDTLQKEQQQQAEITNLIENQQDYLFRCAICGTAEGDSSNLSSNISLQTNATVRCGHQLYVAHSKYFFILI
jgi:hypothetical protein